MKRVVLILSAAVFTTLISCKDEIPNEALTSTSETEVIDNSGDLALATSTHIENEDQTEYLYVTATSGLSLREFGNLHSEKLARMPYGTKVKVISAEKNATMNVAGIKGGMNEVAFNHKRGFAFNGYLSKYFPPERDITAKGYANELNQLFPKVLYTEVVTGTPSKPVNTETITLPNAQWHEAFFMAQRLYDFPKEFAFPSPKGKKEETIFDGKPKKGIWISQLEVNRKDNELEKIAYVYKTKGFTKTISITKNDDLVKISKTETIE